MAEYPTVLELQPGDNLHIDFTQSTASHVVALHTPTAELEIAPIEKANLILSGWISRIAYPGAIARTISIHLLDAGGARAALEDPAMLEALEGCQPLLFACACELDAEEIAEALRWHLALMNLEHGRH